jgi:TP901 family phage tail tape measure protein
MALNEKRTSTVILNGKQPAKTIKDLAADIRILSNHLKKLDKDSDAFKKGASKMRQLRKELGDANQQMRTTGRSWQRFWSTVKATTAGVLFGNVLTNLTTMVGQVIPNLIRKNAELSDSYADIRKTTGLTEEQVKNLDKTLGTFNTRTPRKELRELAVEAGRLGIEGVSNIAGFVKAADQIKVALGDDLGQDAAANLRVLGKLTEQFNVAEKEAVSFETALLKTGSAINELSASGSTQAEYLVNFTRRVSGVANSADLAIDKVLGIAATLDEAGQNVEVSGTTISKVLVKMFTDTETFATIAGMELQDFTKLLNTDANQALITFLEGLNNGNGSLTELATKLQDAELEGSRATAVLAALAANTEKLAEKQTISNKALVDGTSLTEEFNVKNQNLAATVDKIGRKLNSIWINSKLRKGVTAMVNLFGDLLGVNKELSDELEQQRVDLQLLEGKILRLNVGNEERVRLLKQLKEQYPGYLSDLDAEKATNDEITTSLRKVNEQLLNKIMLQQQDEAIRKQTDDMVETLREINSIELAWEKNINAVADKYGIVLDRSKSVVEMQKQLRKELEAMNVPFGDQQARSTISADAYARRNRLMRRSESQRSAQDVLQEERDRMAERLGLNSTESAGGGGGSPAAQEAEIDRLKGQLQSGGTSPGKEIDHQKEKLEQFLAHLNNLREQQRISLLSHHEQELAAIDAKYDDELEKLNHFLENKAITKEEYNLKADEIEALRREEHQLKEAAWAEEARLKEEEAQAQYLADKEAFLAELGQLQKTDAEREIDAINQRYDEMLSLAEMYGIDSMQIEALRQEELFNLRQYYRDKDLEAEADYRFRMQDVYANFYNALIGFMEGIGEEESSFSEFARGLAFFNLAISQARAVGNALQTSTAPTPDNIATGGLAGLAKFATISGAILTTANGLRALIAGESIPSYGRSTFFRDGGMLTVGPSHQAGGMALLGYNGTKQAELEGGEAILSRETVANNYSIVRQLLEQSTLKAGAAIPQFNYGGMIGAAQQMQPQNVTTTLDAAAFSRAVAEFSQAVKNIEAKVVFNNQLITDLRKNIERQQEQRARGY